MKFEDFEKFIQKEFMEAVLKPFSPYIDHRREHMGHYYPSYEIGVTTKLCKFLFAWEEGGGVMIAPLFSSFENTHDSWFSLDRILCSVTRQPFIWESPYESLPRDEQIISTLYATRKALAPYVNQIVLMFSSEETMSKWILYYEHYEDEQFKSKYPALYEAYKRDKQVRKLKKR